MPKCVYCGELYDVHKGVTFVKLDGSINYLCSSKCRKNMAMKRRKVRWIIKDKKAKEIKAAPVPVETKEEIVKDIEGDNKVPEEVAKKEEKIAEKEEEKSEENK